MAGFNQRFSPAVRALREAARDGRVGAPTGLRLATGTGRRDPPAWKRSRASGGGVLLDLGSHAADLARHVLGEEVRSVRASLGSIRTEDDTATIAMTMESGRLAQAWVTFVGITESRAELIGERGALVADGYAGTLDLVPLEPAWSRPARARRGLGRLGGVARTLLGVARPLPLDVTYRGALTAFVEAVRRGRSIAPDLEDGFRSLAVVLAAEESARTGRAIAPADP
jgi:1,5-anhydro-D-fructose reductase (1,5-anhydro-D-mannitol-forming)